MKRKIIDQLLLWKDKSGRMPLIVNGARQVGKTYILKEFASTRFDQFVYINLETNSKVNSYFDGDINPIQIVQYLETVTEIRIIAGSTLNPSRQPYFSQHRENRVFWDLERLFGNIAVKIDLIAK